KEAKGRESEPDGLKNEYMASFISSFLSSSKEGRIRSSPAAETFSGSRKRSRTKTSVLTIFFTADLFSFFPDRLLKPLYHILRGARHVLRIFPEKQAAFPL
ncbi:MAG: hypothetical protein IK035_00790, partial [Firmicutes bacterium]|nr:hypothetical protein [Bacillota bacterium]